MQKNNKFFDDFAKMASGAAGGLLDMKRELDALIAHKCEQWLQRLNLPTREELDTLHAMLAKARAEQEELKKRVEMLEKRNG